MNQKDSIDTHIYVPYVSFHLFSIKRAHYLMNKEEQPMQKEMRGLDSVEFDESQSMRSEGNDNAYDSLYNDNK